MPPARFTPRHYRLAELLLKARVEKSLSQAELGRRLGRPQSFVAKIENQERRLDVIEFLDLTKAMGIRPEQLLKDLKEE